MKIANLFMNPAVNDETQITISVALIALGQEKPLVSGRWFEDKMLEWSDADVQGLVWDLNNNKLDITI